jgi:hypothetical protein
MYKIVEAHGRFIILKSQIERRWLFKKVLLWHMIDENYEIINYPCTVKIHKGFDTYNEAEIFIKKMNEALTQVNVSYMLCGSFDPENETTSDTKCKCGREKWEHPTRK